MKYNKESDICINPHIKYEYNETKSNEMFNSNKISRNRNNINNHRHFLTSNI